MDGIISSRRKKIVAVQLSWVRQWHLLDGIISRRKKSNMQAVLELFRAFNADLASPG